MVPCSVGMLLRHRKQTRTHQVFKTRDFSNTFPVPCSKNSQVPTLIASSVPESWVGEVGTQLRRHWVGHPPAHPNEEVKAGGSLGKGGQEATITARKGCSNVDLSPGSSCFARAELGVGTI